MANEADETPEEIVEHLAELGLHAEDDDLSDMLDNAPTTPHKYVRGGMMRSLITAVLVLSSGFCLAEDLPKITNKTTSLTAEQAVDLVAKKSGNSTYTLMA